MILWLRSQILEDRLLPIALHVIPVVNHAVSDGVVDAISWGFSVGQRFIANEEIKVLYTPLGRKMAWFTRNSRRAGRL